MPDGLGGVPAIMDVVDYNLQPAPASDLARSITLSSAGRASNDSWDRKQESTWTAPRTRTNGLRRET